MISPVRVLHVIKGLGPGGAEQLLVNQLRVRGRGVAYEVAYAVPEKNHHVEEIRSLGVDVHLVDGLGAPGPRAARALRSLIIEREIDVVHVHSPLVAATVRLALRTLAPSHRPKLVSTEHNRWPRHHPLTRAANRATMRFDDAAFAVSNDVRASMPIERRSGVQVLVHGIDLGAVTADRAARAEMRAALGLDESARVVGIVANFRREKRYDVWLRVARAVCAADPGVHFVSVGQGPLEADVRAEVRRGPFADRIHILGGRSDATRVMAAFDIFLLTSDHEGLPVALMEAMAIGLPVVATAVGGLCDVVRFGREGYLVARGDADALAHAVEVLLGAPELAARIGAHAARRAQLFDVRRAVGALEACYVDLAAARERPLFSRS